MSEVTAQGAGREEKDKNNVELSEKTDKSNKSDVEISDIDNVITYMWSINWNNNYFTRKLLRFKLQTKLWRGVILLLKVLSQASRR